MDPCTLSPAHEVNLFVNAFDVAGFSGSQVLLTVATREPGRQLYFDHDESSEMRSISYSPETSTATSPSRIHGSRARFLLGYSEQSIHQQILLSEDAVSADREWFGLIDWDERVGPATLTPAGRTPAGRPLAWSEAPS